MAEGEVTLDKALERLESIADRLEDPALDLDEAVRIYEEGLRLYAECAKRLDAADLRITQLADALADGDRRLIDGAVPLHREDELAVLSRLHGLARQHERVRDRRHADVHARELARPQAVIAVGEAGLELDRVGGGVDDVVDEGEFAVD